jgi:hypothetical protein
LLLLSTVAIAACEPRYGHRRGYHDPYGDSYQDVDDAAWDIVRRDPCRYDEYRRFADEHKNPEKRRRFMHRLAREGCSREREYYRDRNYERDRDYDPSRRY